MSNVDPFAEDPELSALLKKDDSESSLADLIAAEKSPASPTQATPAPAEVAARLAPPKPETSLNADEKRIRDLEDQVARLSAKKLVATDPDETAVVASTEKTILIHFLLDGFTAWGKIWFQGQEVEIDIPGQSFEDTKDRTGKSWLEMDDRAQMLRYKKIYFRRGPWPGQPYENEVAQQKEDQRRKAAPTLPVMF